MRLNRAIYLVYNKNRVFKRMVKYVQNWDQNLTLTENSIKLGIAGPNAVTLARKYKLKYKKR